MYISEKKVDNDEWVILDGVNDGQCYLIQNVSLAPVSYCVLDRVPDNKKIKANVIAPWQQVSFKKGNGDLYIRKSTYNDGYISIELSEA